MKEALKTIKNNKWILIVFIIAMAGYVLLGYFWKEVGVAIITGIVTTALVLVTVEYTKHTKAMAEEMREQRYDTFRPVIDIEEVNSDKGPAFRSIDNRPTTDDEKISTNPFEFVLRNYGAGAAIDVYSFYGRSSSTGSASTTGRVASSIGNIQANGSKEIRSDLKNLKFILAKKIGSQWCLVVFYRDVYGRCFETKRSVTLEGETFKIGSFAYRKLDKQKDIALINKIWPSSKSEVSL